MGHRGDSVSPWASRLLCHRTLQRKDCAVKPGEQGPQTVGGKGGVHGRSLVLVRVLSAFCSDSQAQHFPPRPRVLLSLRAGGPPGQLPLPGPHQALGVPAPGLLPRSPPLAGCGAGARVQVCLQTLFLIQLWCVVKTKKKPKAKQTTPAAPGRMSDSQIRDEGGSLLRAGGRHRR